MKKELIYQHEPGDGSIARYIAKVDKLERNDIRVRLKYANTDEWATRFRGKTVAALHDNGDSVTIQFADGKRRLNLDYSEVEELRMLLHFLEVDVAKMQRGKDAFISKLKKYKEYK